MLQAHPLNSVVPGVDSCGLSCSLQALVGFPRCSGALPCRLIRFSCSPRRRRLLSTTRDSRGSSCCVHILLNRRILVLINPSPAPVQPFQPILSQYSDIARIPQHTNQSFLKIISSYCHLYQHVFILYHLVRRYTANHRNLRHGLQLEGSSTKCVNSPDCDVFIFQHGVEEVTEQRLKVESRCKPQQLQQLV